MHCILESTISRDSHKKVSFLKQFATMTMVKQVTRQLTMTMQPTMAMQLLRMITMKRQPKTAMPMKAR